MAWTESTRLETGQTFTIIVKLQGWKYWRAKLRGKPTEVPQAFVVTAISEQ